MLVLSRQRDETIMIGDDIEVTVVDIRGDKVRLGINAPKEISVHRKEVYDAIRRDDKGSIETHYVIAVYCGLWLAGEAQAASDAAELQWIGPGDLDSFDFTPDVPQAILRSRELLGL